MLNFMSNSTKHEKAGKPQDYCGFQLKRQNGAADVVTAADIGEQLREQITIIQAVPQMVVGVDNRQLGLDDRFAVLSSQSCRTGAWTAGMPGVGTP